MSKETVDAVFENSRKALRSISVFSLKSVGVLLCIGLALGGVNEVYEHFEKQKRNKIPTTEQECKVGTAGTAGILFNKEESVIISFSSNGKDYKYFIKYSEMEKDGDVTTFRGKGISNGVPMSAEFIRGYSTTLKLDTEWGKESIYMDSDCKNIPTVTKL